MLSRTIVALSVAAALVVPILFGAEAQRVDVRMAATDLDGKPVRPFDAGSKKAAVIFFIAHDCPVANYYSQEIGRIYERSSSHASVTLVYAQPDLAVADARKHYGEYGHHGYPAVIDRGNRLSKAAGATITPEAVVLRPDGEIAYRGRIDNLYFAPGRRRPAATEFDLRDAIDAVLAGRPAPAPRGPTIGCYISPPLPSILPPPPSYNEMKNNKQ